MSTHLRSTRFIVFAILALSLVFVAGCRVSPLRNIKDAPVAVNGNTHPDATLVKDAIIRAGHGLGWRMTPVREGLIQGTLNIRTHRAVVEIPYSGSQYSIVYKDSSNLYYNEKKGTIHTNYNGWVQNLDNAIKRELTYAK